MCAPLRAVEAREVVWGQDGGLFETSYGTGIFLGVVRNARNCECFSLREGFAISSAGVFGFAPLSTGFDVWGAGWTDSVGVGRS